MRRANEIKILDTNERKLKTKSSFTDFSSPSLLAIPFNLNQLSFELLLCFYILAKNRVSSKNEGKTSPIISVFTDFLLFAFKPFECFRLKPDKNRKSLSVIARFGIFFDIFIEGTILMWGKFVFIVHGKGMNDVNFSIIPIYAFESIKILQ